MTDKKYIELDERLNKIQNLHKEDADNARTNNEIQENLKDQLSYDQTFLESNEGSQLKPATHALMENSMQEKMSRAEGQLEGSLTQIANHQRVIDQLKFDNEYSMRRASEMNERYKNLVGWMQVIVTSTKPPSSTQEEYDFSDEAVRRLKTAIAASITQSRENAIRNEELRTSLSTKEMQISHLKSIISQMGADFHRMSECSEKTKSEGGPMNTDWIGNSALQQRVNYLESQLEEAEIQLSRYKENSAPEKINSLNSNANFRQLLAEMLNQSAWICSESEDEILEVIHRVLATLTNKTETCFHLQTQLSELTDELADSKRKIEHLENECLTARKKLCRSPAKSVEFLDRITDLEDSHEKLLQFLKQLENRLPVDQGIFAEMSVADRRNYILDFISKACESPPAKSESELAPRLHRRVQRLQDYLVSRELQLKTWQQKVAKLEEQLVLARKGEAEAIEKQAMAEQRACRLRNNEIEVNRLKNEALQLRTQLKDSKDAKDSLEVKALRVLELEESVRNLEELKLGQANRIGELVTALEKEKAATTRKLLQQEEEQRVRFNVEQRDTNQLLEDLRTESTESYPAGPALVSTTPASKVLGVIGALPTGFNAPYPTFDFFDIPSFNFENYAVFEILWVGSLECVWTTWPSQIRRFCMAWSGYSKNPDVTL
ncbi:hypothetical protein Aperf_G00000095133 [Anoplocephala perfoliata]